MTAPSTPPATPPGGGAPLELHVVAGGAPTPEEEAALTIAVGQVIAQRDLRRTVAPPLWGVVGRLEARDSLAIRSRAMLPRDTAWTPVAHGPQD